MSPRKIRRQGWVRFFAGKGYSVTTHPMKDAGFVRVNADKGNTTAYEFSGLVLHLWGRRRGPA